MSLSHYADCLSATLHKLSPNHCLWLLVCVQPLYYYISSMAIAYDMPLAWNRWRDCHISSISGSTRKGWLKGIQRRSCEYNNKLETDSKTGITARTVKNNYNLVPFYPQGDPGKPGEAGPSGEPGIPVCIWWAFGEYYWVTGCLTFTHMKLVVSKLVYIIFPPLPSGWHRYPRREGDSRTQRSGCEFMVTL